MARRPIKRRRRFDATRYLVPTLLLGVAVAGALLLAYSAYGPGTEGPRRRGVPEGAVAVPVAARSIPAYTRVTLDHLIDPATGDLRAMYLPEDSILEGTMVDARNVLGRVTATDKHPGQLFGEGDFFPPGTREGIVAGIPTGKRALRIDARKVNGIVGLARGDRFDLIATMNLGGPRASRVAIEGMPQGGVGADVQTSTVVQNGIVVQPLQTRSIPGKTTQLVEEMVIAVDPDEAEQLTRALHSSSSIDCVPRSGRPDVAGGQSDQELPAVSSGPSMIETIVGGQRRMIMVPSSGDAPAPTSETVAGEPSGEAHRTP